MRAAPTPPGRIVHVPAPLRVAPARRRARGLGVDRRPGHRRRDLGRLGRDAVPVDLRLGRHRDAVRVARPGLGVGQPVRDHPRHPRLGGRVAWASAAGRSRRSRDGIRLWPAVVGLDVLHLARARRDRRQRHADGRPGRLHRAHGGPDGPVRPRPVARPGRDVHRLVPDAQPAAPSTASCRRRRRPRRGASRRTTRIPTRSIRRRSSRRPFATRPARRHVGDPAGRAGRPRHWPRSSSTACRRPSPSRPCSATRRSCQKTCC